MPDFHIDGNPGGILSRAATMRSKAEAFISTGDGLAKITTDGWNSRAGDRFREKFETEPERWRESGDGFLTAASALEVYASELESAQSRARWAEGEYARGEQVSQNARSAYDADVSRARSEADSAAAAGKVVTLTILPFHDPGAAIRQGALDEYAGAKADLEAAAHTCADGVRAGCAAAPEKRKWYESVGAAIGGFLAGAGEALMDLGELAMWLTNPSMMMMNDLMGDISSGMTPEEIAAKNKLRLEDVEGMFQALQDDPLEFGKNLGKAMLDWDTWADDPARALGHLLPDAIAAVATGGAGTAATRGAKGATDLLEGLRGLGRLDDLSGVNHLDDLGGLSKLDDFGDYGRVYGMSDDLDHTTRFAPEQLGSTSDASHLIDDALANDDLFARNGVDTPWTRDELVDKINTPTSELSAADRAVLNDLRDTIPTPEAGDAMQKVLQPDQVGEYLSGTSSRYDNFDPSNIGGSVTRADDTAQLGTPQELHDGLALNFDNTPFSPGDESFHIVRYEAADDGYVVPRNPDMGGNVDMPRPFTGNGFTLTNDLVPEFQTNGLTRMPDGAEMWQTLDSGTQRLVAVLRDGEWVRVAGGGG